MLFRTYTTALIPDTFEKSAHKFSLLNLSKRHNIIRTFLKCVFKIDKVYKEKRL